MTMVFLLLCLFSIFAGAAATIMDGGIPRGRFFFLLAGAALTHAGHVAKGLGL